MKRERIEEREGERKLIDSPKDPEDNAKKYGVKHSRREGGRGEMTQ